MQMTEKDGWMDEVKKNLRKIKVKNQKQRWKDKTMKVEFCAETGQGPQLAVLLREEDFKED